MAEVSLSAADDDALSRAKQVLRHAVQTRRESRSPEQRSRDDEARLAVLDGALDSQPPPTVAAYLSAGVEPGTLQMVAWLAAHSVRVLLPVLSRGPAPAWAAYAGPDALRLGRRGILEPAAEPLPDGSLAEAELILCPGLAANEQRRPARPRRRLVRPRPRCRSWEPGLGAAELRRADGGHPGAELGPAGVRGAHSWWAVPVRPVSARGTGSATRVPDAQSAVTMYSSVVE